MSNRGSIIMLSATGTNHSIYSTEIQGNSYFGILGDPSHTIQVTYADFTGKLHFQATLIVEPTATDWFSITPGVVTPGHSLTSEGYAEYGGGDTADGSVAYTVKGNYTWLRLYLDREDIPRPDDLSSEQYPHGQILRAVLLT